MSCGYVGRPLQDKDHDTRSLQDVYFNDDFALQDDCFTRLYERSNARRRLREIREFKDRGRILEVGVGRGRFLMTLQAAGYEVEGLDVSRAVCTTVRARSGITVACGTVETHAKSHNPGTYSGIVMSHVLEHVDSLASTLIAVRCLLKPDGILYIAVPNLSCWNARLPGWGGYEPYHVHYFGPDSLRRLLKSAGFNILHERTFEPISGWFNALLRSIRRRSPDLDGLSVGDCGNNRRRGPLWILYNLSRIITGILLSPLRWAQSCMGYGEELVMIARPEQP